MPGLFEIAPFCAQGDMVSISPTTRCAIFKQAQTHAGLPLSEAKLTSVISVKQKGNPMATTTQDCKDFLSDFIQSNPSLVLSIYGYTANTPQAKALIADATTAKKWKRGYKCKPGGGNYEFDDYDLFSKTAPIARMGYGSLPSKPANDFVSERGFYLDPDTYDTGVGFVVLEDKSGTLALGNYIGD